LDFGVVHENYMEQFKENAQQTLSSLVGGEVFSSHGSGGASSAGVDQMRQNSTEQYGPISTDTEETHGATASSLGFGGRAGSSSQFPNTMQASDPVVKKEELLAERINGLDPTRREAFKIYLKTLDRTNYQRLMDHLLDNPDDLIKYTVVTQSDIDQSEGKSSSSKGKGIKKKR